MGTRLWEPAGVEAAGRQGWAPLLFTEPCSFSAKPQHGEAGREGGFQPSLYLENS